MTEIVATEETPVDISTLIDRLAEAAKASPDNPEPLARGTFAMYPMKDGGVMFVTAVSDGPMAGTHHHRIPAGLIRGIAALAGGGGKMKAIKGMFTGRKG